MSHQSSPSSSSVEPTSSDASVAVPGKSGDGGASFPEWMLGGSSPPPPERQRRSVLEKLLNGVAHVVELAMASDASSDRDGLLQRLDPRVKLASILGFAVTASFVHSLPVLVALVVATMGLAAASGVPVASFSAKVWSSAGLFALLISAASATAWITPGPVLVPLGPLSITAPGLLIAARLVARVIAGAGFGLLVVWTTRWTDLLRALSALGVPDLVVATLAMTQKQIMSLLRTVENMHLARESRMLSTGSARENRGWVVDRMAFVARRSMKTADDVYDAMLARGFSGSMPSLVDLRATARDWAWMAAGVAAAMLVLGIDRKVFPT